MPLPSFRTDDSVQISYRDEGRGPPLVLVHGWSLSGRVFDGQVRALRDQARLIVPDLRGCGESGWLSGTARMSRYAQDLAQLVDHLGLDEFTLVGWSMGGAVATEYARQSEYRGLRGMGLVDFPPRLEEEPAVADKVCHALHKRRDTFSRDFLARMFLVAPSEATLADLAAQSLRMDPDTACEMYRAMRPPQPPLPVPTSPVAGLLIFPERGWFRKALEEWKRIFPTHVTPAFPASRHCPFLEEPQRFNQVLGEFLESVAGS